MILNSTASLSIVGDSGSLYNVYIYNGSGLVSGLNPDNYTIAVSMSSFSTKHYRVSVVDRTYQNVSMYMSNGSAVIFNFKTTGGTVLSGALLRIYTYINGSLILVESGVSDVSGKFQAYLLPNEAYYFNASNSGYSPNWFSLNPVLYTSYDITLIPYASGTTNPSATISYSPTVFFVGTPNMSISVASSFCALTNFSFNVSWDSSSNSNSTTNGCGYTFNVPLNLTSATYVNVFYQYYLSNGAYQNWTFTYALTTPLTNHTLMTIGTNTYGMLVGDRVWLATIIVLIVMGVGFVALGVGGSLVFGSIFWMLFGQANFVPWYILYPSLVIGFLLIINRGSNG
jgi:hypothetical protein